MTNLIKELKNDRIFMLRWNAFVKNPFRFVSVRLSNLVYDIKCFFKPYNVVTCSHLPRSWSDRDHLMFHAMFQLLVDFVELEHPFRDWCDDSSRYTDIPAMREWIEKHYNTEEGRKSNHCDWYTDEEKAAVDESTKQRYQIYKEILYLYEWYVDRRYDLDRMNLHDQTGLRLKLAGNGFERVPNGKPALLTEREVIEIEEEHRTVCNVMLRRILSVRENLWT